jgi:hypothetical protein
MILFSDLITKVAKSEVRFEVRDRNKWTEVLIDNGYYYLFVLIVFFDLLFNFLWDKNDLSDPKFVFSTQMNARD